MNTKNENTHEDQLLKDAYEQIAPDDSWEGLRERIGNRLAESQVSSMQHRNQSSLSFWKGLSFAMAACFVMTAGILFYVLGTNNETNNHQQQVPYASNDMVPKQSDLDTLRDTFEQVRQLFGAQSRWIAIGSDNNSDVGLSDNTPANTKTEKLIIVRLAVSYNNDDTSPKYYDIITYEDQLADINLPLAGAHGMQIALKPVIQKDGTISLEINANINGASKSKSTCAVADDSFTPLINMRVNDDWVRIDGVGRFVSI